MLGNRYLVVGYTAKDGGMEFTSVQGYVLACDEACPCHWKIRSDCLSFANRDGHSFLFLQINFMAFMSEADYNAFFCVEEEGAVGDPL